MSISIRLETSGLHEMVADLGRAMTLAPVAVRKAVEVTSRTIKDDARARARGIGPHAKLYPSSIGYDITIDTPVLVQSEIGPDKGGPQGPLGTILENGSIHNPPHPHIGPAADAAEADFEAGLDMAIAGTLW